LRDRSIGWNEEIAAYANGKTAISTWDTGVLHLAPEAAGKAALERFFDNVRRIS
jgi:hypothetical protein